MFHNRFSFVLFLRSKAPRYFSFSRLFIFAFYRRFFHVFSYHTISDELLTFTSKRQMVRQSKQNHFIRHQFVRSIHMNGWLVGRLMICIYIFIFILNIDSNFNTSNYELKEEPIFYKFFLLKLWDIEFARKKTSNDKTSWFHWKLRLFFCTDRQITSFNLKIFITNFLVRELLGFQWKRYDSTYTKEKICPLFNAHKGS